MHLFNKWQGRNRGTMVISLNPSFTIWGWILCWFFFLQDCHLSDPSYWMTNGEHLNAQMGWGGRLGRVFQPAISTICRSHDSVGFMDLKLLLCTGMVFSRLWSGCEVNEHLRPCFLPDKEWLFKIEMLPKATWYIEVFIKYLIRAITH